MFEPAGNKKRKTRKRSIILIGMLVLFVIQVRAEQKSKFLFGIYSGWSFGLGYEFDWHSRPSRSDDYNLNLNLGGYVQYNLSEQFGLQINFNFQNGTNPWTFQNWGWPDDSGTDNISFISFNLNGVVNYLRLKNVQFYLLGGSGISSGDWEDFSGMYLNFVGGTGVKIYLKPDSRPAINFAGTFHHLLKPDKYGSEHANYLRFLIGYEF